MSAVSPPVVSLSLRVQPSSGPGFAHALRDGDTTIGRESQNDLALRDNRVSRRHAVITVADGRASVTDLASRNGTFLNGQRLGDGASPLTTGDVIRIGDFSLLFEPADAIPFALPSAPAMREVLQKAPEEVVQSSARPDAVAGSTAAATLAAELEKKTRILGLFYELSRTLGSVFSLPDVHEKVMNLLMQVTPAARVVIFQILERGEMRPVASRTRHQAADAAASAQEQPLRVSRTVFDNVARQRVSVLLENTHRDDTPIPESLRLEQAHSVMAAPILGRKGLLGLIYVDQDDRLQTFSAADLDLLNAVAVQAGIAIDTVRAHEALQREAKARENYERFLPQQVVDDVMRDPGKEITPGGTRLVVTALFADVRGFTTLAESAPPEHVVDLLNRFFTLVSEIVFRYGGTLDKYIGDGVLALFGAPYPTERDAVKAVRAAIDLQRALVGFNTELLRDSHREIGVGIGISTGPAIVGFIGSETRLDYTAIGDTINTAARLENLAKAGQIIISETTMQAVDASVAYTPLDAVQVKGRAARLQIADVRWKR